VRKLFGLNYQRWILAGLALPVLMSCSSYQTKVQDFRNDLKKDQPAAAAARVKDKAWEAGDDQVVYLFEYATAMQLAGDYKESIKALLKAEDLTDIKDYHSVSRITGSLLLNQGMIQYKGDNFEKVLINAMLAINYLMLNNLDDAMVEARKLNDKLYKFRFEGKKNYEQNPFAFYLNALIEEQEKDVDSAYIDFKKTYDLNPRLDYLREDLIRSAIAAQRMDDADKWRKMWPDVKPVDLRTVGEVVLLYQQGWGPQKRPNPSFPRVPKLYPLYSNTQRVRLEVENDPSAALSESVVSVTDVAIKTLDEDYAGLIAMRAAGIATKAVVADQIAQHNQLLGAIAMIGLNATDQADLRQWSSLPSSFQVVKLRLKPGTYKLRAVGLDGGLRPTGENSPWWTVTVAPHKKAWLNWRSVR
jgi:hypothetical protein